MISSKIIGGGLFLILCLVSVSMAQNGLQEMQPLDDKEEMMKEIQGHLRSIQKLLDRINETDAQNANLACRCAGLQCTCCQRIHIPALRLNDDCCLSIMYLKQNIGFLTTLKFGSRILFSKEVSVRNPIPICVGHPMIPHAQACIQFNDLSIGSQWIHGCATFYIKVPFYKFSYNLGCFSMRYRNEAESGNGLNWIEAQPDVPFPVVEDDAVEMENVEQPLRDEMLM